MYKARFMQRQQSDLRHAPKSLAVTFCLILISYYWLHSPATYLAASISLGGVCFCFWVLAWRTQSSVAYYVSIFALFTGQTFLRAWLVPHSLFTLVQGILISECCRQLMMWLFRSRLEAMHRVPTESGALTGASR